MLARPFPRTHVKPPSGTAMEVGQRCELTDDQWVEHISQHWNVFVHLLLVRHTTRSFWCIRWVRLPESDPMTCKIFSLLPLYSVMRWSSQIISTDLLEKAPHFREGTSQIFDDYFYIWLVSEYVRKYGWVPFGDIAVKRWQCKICTSTNRDYSSQLFVGQSS